jgi:hypothetical protein
MGYRKKLELLKMKNKNGIDTLQKNTKEFFKDESDESYI